MSQEISHLKEESHLCDRRTFIAGAATAGAGNLMAPRIASASSFVLDGGQSQEVPLSEYAGKAYGVTSPTSRMQPIDLWEFFEPGLRKRLSELDTEASMIERVKSVLFKMLPSGCSSIEETASRLGMSKRSLQRRLTDESSSYQEILHNTRRELAQHYLRRATLSPGEIAYLLGFHDSNSFLRAFKEWTGSTPTEYRNDDACDMQVSG